MFTSVKYTSVHESLIGITLHLWECSAALGPTGTADKPGTEFCAALLNWAVWACVNINLAEKIIHRVWSHRQSFSNGGRKKEASGQMHHTPFLFLKAGDRLDTWLETSKIVPGPPQLCEGEMIKSRRKNKSIRRGVAYNPSSLLFKKERLRFFAFEKIIALLRKAWQRLTEGSGVSSETCKNGVGEETVRAEFHLFSVERCWWMKLTEAGCVWAADITGPEGVSTPQTASPLWAQFPQKCCQPSFPLNNNFHLSEQKLKYFLKDLIQLWLSPCV